ncbi:hypothetical protein EK21DRAFT_115883 [Setomelanomma holmii]|uniref:Heterokaryon incompatibility domain-containing protein n=1 Tax=Setomelanomma holmii TaxID=210430 RepID=A0A9P4H2Z9_9PLEO|nr:hypothetical protein EK21DRAFT_115883 [Setomelanomma holmii]
MSWNNLFTGCTASALFSLADCSYWTRMWTIQEFSASVPLVYWGNADRAPGFGALRAIREVSATQAFSKSGGQFRGRLHWNFSGFKDPEYEPPALSAQFPHLSPMHSTDGGDKIFALKGLFHRGYRDLNVDYDQPLWDVYTAATRLTLTAEKSLLLLGFVARSQSEDRLPSWTVDWDDKLAHTMQVSGAASDPEPVFAFVNDGMVLRLSGRFIGVISGAISTIFPQLDILPIGFIFDGHPIDVCMRNRTCLRMLFNFYQKNCQSWYPDFASYLQAVTKFLDPEKKYNAATQSAATHIFEGREHAAMLEIGDEETLFLNKLNGTVLFTTTDTSFGVARGDGIRSGDRIAPVSGLGNPIILRPLSTSFELITSAIVSGVTFDE